MPNREKKSDKKRDKKVFKFKSVDIADGSSIDSRYTCDGKDEQPRFQWKNAPKGTRTFAIIVDDPDAIPVTGSVFTNYAVINIPIEEVKTDRDVHHGSDDRDTGWPVSSNGTVLKNDFGNYRWNGPCPPRGDKAHRYRFALYALSDCLPNVTISTKLTQEIFERSFGDLIVGKSEFVATYKRKVID